MIDNPVKKNQILTLQNVADILQRTKRSIWRMWRKEQILPPPIQINGRTIGWRESEFNAWLDRHNGK